FNGMARQSPGLAAAVALFLFGLARIPPRVGFACQYRVFYAPIGDGHLELGVIRVLTRVFGVCSHLRVLVALSFVVAAPPNRAREDALSAPPPPVGPSPPPPNATVGATAPSAGPRAAPAVAARTAPVHAPVHAPTTTRRTLTPGTWLALALAALLTLGLGIL